MCRRSNYNLSLRTIFCGIITVEAQFRSIRYIYIIYRAFDAKNAGTYVLSLSLSLSLSFFPAAFFSPASFASSFLPSFRTAKAASRVRRSSRRRNLGTRRKSRDDGTAKTCQPVIVPRCNCRPFSRTAPVYPYSSAQPYSRSPGNLKIRAPFYVRSRAEFLSRATLINVPFLSLSQKYIEQCENKSKIYSTQYIPLS